MNYSILIPNLSNYTDLIRGLEEYGASLCPNYTQLFLLNCILVLIVVTGLNRWIEDKLQDPNLKKSPYFHRFLEDDFYLGVIFFANVIWLVLSIF